MRQLKYHEQKLLKKVDFLTFSASSTSKKSHLPNHALTTIRRYHLPDQSHYHSYNSLVGEILKLSHLLSKLPRSSSAYKDKYETLLLSKLYDVGLLERGAKLEDLLDESPSTEGKKGRKVTVAAFCRRRLPVVMVAKLKMAQTVKDATMYIEQGHVRVGTDVITDPSFLVTRNMEDFVTWVDTSKLKRHVMSYNDELDDYDML
ncbi:putative IMP3-component of the U3 small nucleolar ribonucleoprotein [Atractiella rhizophila]|nr:putative IMP3-component of the U3 small nucleolar ribonucleoprotein [Atractiella rhizophila]